MGSFNILQICFFTECYATIVKINRYKLRRQGAEKNPAHSSGILAAFIAAAGILWTHSLANYLFKATRWIFIVAFAVQA
jgi:hypothetical protein